MKFGRHWVQIRKPALAKHGLTSPSLPAPAYTFMGFLSLARCVIVSFSSRLLYLGIAFGIARACASFVIIGGIIIDKLFKPATPVPGSASVMSVVLFTAGLTNIMLGLVGLYIAEMVERSRGRPIYVIRQ
jgi:polyisoprenyl-phosphate glycosyltransferase